MNKGLVQVLINQNLEILEIFHPSQIENKKFIVVSSFEPPITGGIQNTPYSHVSGFDITEILMKNITEAVTFAQITSNYVADLKNRQEFKFSLGHEWILYSK